jgi:peptidoglycan/xylan/chitin deacetylase (PgdA/CDA1 family)
MYHELELPGRSLCDSEPGYVRYIVHDVNFKQQINWLKTQGWQGLSVTRALAGADEPAVVLTFDDGAETDLIAAAPALMDAKFGATFFITTGFLGKRGYLSPAQVLELADLGFDIGSHSQTHPYLSDLSEDRLKSEILDSKLQLEEITGRAVHHFSCPGGRWDSRVAEFTRRSGYDSMLTSEARANTSSSDRFSLGRVAVMRATSLTSFEDVCTGRGLWKLKFAENLRKTAKHLLGNSGYDRMRAALLDRKESRQ